MQELRRKSTDLDNFWQKEVYATAQHRAVKVMTMHHTYSLRPSYSRGVLIAVNVGRDVYGRLTTVTVGK